jgi:uncharacterized SAM-binding protein YcdF (DUF218 family)
LTDAIVIFGCAVLRGGVPSPMLRARVEAAASFGRTLRSHPVFVPTGGVGRHGPSEASVMAGLLRSQGVPAERIVAEETATDTLSSVLAVRRLLGNQVGAVYAATSGFHQPRCVVLLRLAGLDARFSPAPPPAKNAAKRWYWRLREIPALPYDAALILLPRLGGRLWTKQW